MFKKFKNVVIPIYAKSRNKMICNLFANNKPTILPENIRH